MTDPKHLRWSYVSTLTTASMQFIAAATITRFLQPYDYGLAAMAMLCASLTGYFTQLGVGRAIVQKATVTTGNIRAAFTLASLTGICGFLLLSLLSPLLARYFNNNSLKPIIVWFALSLVFQAAGLTSNGLLRRELRIRDIAICDFLSYAVSTFGIGLTMAMHGYGVWALVGSNVSQPLIAAVAYFLARPHSLLPTFDGSDYAHLATFSGKATFTTAIEAVGGSLDMTLMGRVVSASTLGLYGRSLTLSTQPCYQLSMGLTRVFGSSLARAMERSREEGIRLLLASERQLVSLLFPMCTAAALSATTIIPVIFGRQWMAAVPVYQVLCFVAAFDASYDLPAMQLEIANEFRNKIFTQGSFLITFGVLILVVAPRYGILGVALGYLGLQATRSVLFHFLSGWSLRISPWLLLSSWIPGLCCAAIVAVPALLLRHVIPDTGSGAGIRLGIVFFGCLITMIGFYFLFFRDTIYQSWISLFGVKSNTVERVQA